MLKTDKVKLCLRLLMVLVLSIIVVGYGEQIAEANQYDDIGACYTSFDSKVDNCINSQGNCDETCETFVCAGLTGSEYQECMEECTDDCAVDGAMCFGDALSGAPFEGTLSDCLINQVDFTLDMCGMAQYAVAVCNAERDHCYAYAETIEDEELANEVAGECLNVHFTCLDASGIGQCQ